MKHISIIIPGDPPTVTQKNSIRYTMKGIPYHSKNFIRERERVREALMHSPEKPVEPLDEPLALIVTSYYPRPKARKTGPYKATKPDAENALGLIADQLEKTGYVVNDSRFCLEVSLKLYCEKGESTGIAIEIMDMEYYERNRNCIQLSHGSNESRNHIV